MIGYQNNTKLKKKIETLGSRKLTKIDFFFLNSKVLRKVTTIIISIYLVQPHDVTQHMI